MIEMTTTNGSMENLVDRLYSIHREHDESHRRRLIKTVVAEDISVHGLQGQVFGRQSFNEFFRGGGQLIRSTPVDRCFGWFRCGWVLQQPDGTTAIDDETGETYSGLQVSRLSQEGKIAQIVTFMGLTPPRSH